jgi:XTP/dITP diphosphohydrolase
VFFVPEAACTAAELSSEQKNELSHRAKALNQLIARLQEIF